MPPELSIDAFESRSSYSGAMVVRNANAPTLEQVWAAFDGEPGVTVGGRFGNKSLTLRGKVFAMSMKGRLVVKLPEARVTDLVDAGEGERLVMGKRTMREWILLVSEARWIRFAREAHASAGSAQRPARRSR